MAQRPDIKGKSGRFFLLLLPQQINCQRHDTNQYSCKKNRNSRKRIHNLGFKSSDTALQGFDFSDGICLFFLFKCYHLIRCIVDKTLVT